MKYYTIGEIADIMGISKEMVRYYERCGIISPTRHDNNYRTYSIFEYFELMEALALSRFNINIKEIGTIKRNNYFSETNKKLQLFIQESKRKLAYDALLLDRAERYQERIETALLNVGNYWIEKFPEFYVFPFMKSGHDSYEFLNLQKNKSLGTPEVSPFVDSILFFEDNGELWNLGIEKKYADVLDEDQIREATIINENYCMCTIANMGQIGEFDSQELIKSVLNHFDAYGKMKTETPMAVLIGRGIEEQTYHRLLKICIPIKP